MNNINQSMHYNPLKYIRSEQDICTVTDVLIENSKEFSSLSDFHKASAKMLMESCIALITEWMHIKEPTLQTYLL